MKGGTAQCILREGFRLPGGHEEAENVMEGRNGSPVFRLKWTVMCAEIPDEIAGNDDRREGSNSLVRGNLRFFMDCATKRFTE